MSKADEKMLPFRMCPFCKTKGSRFNPFSNTVRYECRCGSGFGGEPYWWETFYMHPDGTVTDEAGDTVTA